MWRIARRLRVLDPNRDFSQNAAFYAELGGFEGEGDWFCFCCDIDNDQDTNLTQFGRPGYSLARPKNEVKTFGSWVCTPPPRLKLGSSLFIPAGNWAVEQHPCFTSVPFLLDREFHFRRWRCFLFPFSSMHLVCNTKSQADFLLESLLTTGRLSESGRAAILPEAIMVGIL